MNNLSVEENVVEGNKLIAEFDGRYTTDSAQWVDTAKRLVHDYEYHSSWDWLMPVVEKIGKMYDNNECFGGLDLDIWNYSLFTPMEKVWLAVVEFIKWHNQSKQ